MKEINKESPAPVVIFCYLRKDHLKKTLDKLSQNILAERTDVYVFSDGAKTEKQNSKIIEIRDFLKEYDKKNKFAKFLVIESNQNKGLADSIIFGVSQIIKQYGKIIVLEDDLVTSKYFLKFMNDSLTKYRANKKIWNISGYTPSLNLEELKEMYFFSKRPWSWGWATWLDRWQKVDWDLKDFEEFIKDKNKVKKFTECGQDLLEMLIAQKQRRQYINSWYIRLAYNQFKYDGLTLYSKESLIKNIGIDGSGTHSTKGNSVRWQVELKNTYDSNELPDLDNLNSDERISSEFKKIKKIDYIKGKLMRFLDNIYLYKIMRKIQKKLMRG